LRCLLDRQPLDAWIIKRHIIAYRIIVLWLLGNVVRGISCCTQRAYRQALAFWAINQLLGLLSYSSLTRQPFKELWDKGLIYESYRVVPYSWAAQTPLSNFEARLDNSFRERTDPALTVKFTLIPDQGNSELTKLLVWTTTTWTLPSNLALCVRPDFDYAVMHRDGERWVLTDSAIERYVRELKGLKQIETIKGSGLIGRRYFPLFPVMQQIHSLSFPATS
jgi:isoleucyl-tRNA synthetase